MRFFRSVVAFLADIVRARRVIFELAKRDFQQQYQGSYLGFVWIFLQPLMLIVILYFVFAIGLRAGGAVGDMPFVIYLVAGMISWLYFSANMSEACRVIKSHAFLVKKVDFRLSVLPIVKLLSSLGAHLVLILLAIILAWSQGFPPTLYTLQLAYYFGAMCALLIGIGWLTSSTSLFVSDVSKIVAIMVQFGFWLTPIFWNIARIPEQYQWIPKLNPVYYLVTGYRDSLVAQVPFWERPDETLYFWSVTLVMMLVGIKIYRKLRPHFAEVV